MWLQQQDAVVGVRPPSLSQPALAPAFHPRSCPSLPPRPQPRPAVPKVTLTPDLILSDYTTIISNLTSPDELRRMVRGMERNTWEAAALLRTHMRVEAALASAIAAVEAHGPAHGPAHGSARVAEADAAEAEVAEAEVAEAAPPPRSKPVGRVRVRTTASRPSRSPGRRASA